MITRHGLRGHVVLAQKCIQIRKLAALTFVAHPDPRLWIPAAWAMKQIKYVIIRTAIFFV